MNAKIQTIPELLICTRGNQTEVARILNCNRATVRKYIDDKDAKKTRYRQRCSYDSPRMG